MCVCRHFWLKPYKPAGGAIARATMFETRWVAAPQAVINAEVIAESRIHAREAEEDEASAAFSSGIADTATKI